MPGAELVGLDHHARVKGRRQWACHRALGADQHAVPHGGLGAAAAHDAQAFHQPAQGRFVAPRLLDRRFNAVFPPVAVTHAEFALGVDAQLPVEALGFQQVDDRAAGQHEVVDLRHFAFHVQAQVVDEHAVGVMGQVAVQKVRRVALPLQALAQAVQLFTRPFAGVGAQARSVSQVLQLGHAIGLVVGGLDEHGVTREVAALILGHGNAGPVPAAQAPESRHAHLELAQP
jgi:hypothetical protein